MSENEKKLMVATIELEKNEKIFDLQTDEVFINRFHSLNRLLRSLVIEDSTSSEATSHLLKQCDSYVQSLTKVDNFKDYKTKLFGAIKLTQTAWINDSKQMLDMWANLRGGDVADQSSNLSASMYSSNNSQAIFAFDFDPQPVPVETQNVSFQSNMQIGSSLKPQTPISMPKPKPAEQIEDLFGFNFTAPSPINPLKPQQQQLQTQPKNQAYVQPFTDLGVSPGSNHSSHKRQPSQQASGISKPPVQSNLGAFSDLF